MGEGGVLGGKRGAQWGNKQERGGVGSLDLRMQRRKKERRGRMG